MDEQFSFERIDEFNARVAEWSARLKAAARSSVSAKTRQNTRLGRSIKVNLIKERGTGQVYRVRVSFAKEGVYVHVGAGRGYGGFRGGKFYSEAKIHQRTAQEAAEADPESKSKARSARASGHMVDVNPASIGKMGTGARRAVPWLTPEVEALMPELVRIAEDYTVGAWVKSKGFDMSVTV